MSDGTLLPGLVTVMPVSLPVASLNSATAVAPCWFTPEMTTRGGAMYWFTHAESVGSETDSNTLPEGLRTGALQFWLPPEQSDVSTTAPPSYTVTRSGSS